MMYHEYTQLLHDLVECFGMDYQYWHDWVLYKEVAQRDLQAVKNLSFFLLLTFGCQKDILE
jgi:hypothetical protein